MFLEINIIEGGKDLIKEELYKFGFVSLCEWCLIVILMLLLLFWLIEKVLYLIDFVFIIIIVLGVMLMLKIGVMIWKYVENKILWGIIIVFGVGILLGNVFLKIGVV